jgi:hypothetical protein
VSAYPPFRYYYLHNFQRALCWIAERHGDLLDEAETAFIREFEGLPDVSRALLVRMLMRKGPLFRSSRLVYEEIGCPLQASEVLAERGWLDPDPALTLDELFGLLTRVELGCVFPASARSGVRKAELLAVLRDAHTLPRRYSGWHAQATDHIFSVTIAPLCERLRLMFFGNLHQDWSEFVLADLGIFQYERVQFEKSSRAFRQRQDVDRYLCLHACRQALEQGERVDTLLPAVADIASDNAWLEMRRGKLLFLIGQHCERLQEWDAALAAYEQCSYPGARHRRLRTLERSDRHGQAWELALQAAQAPESEEESQRVARMLPRLRRRLGHPAMRSGPKAAATLMALVLPRPAGDISVERAVRDHLTAPDAPVHYVENALINSLFGLLCWTVIFAPLPGAFFHPFQRGPADLDAPDFAQRRAPLFDACRAQLDSVEYRHTIQHHFNVKAGLQSPFVSWGLLTPELLQLALDCLPAAHLRRWFERLLQNVKGNRTGLPDLIRFWPGQQRYELIEVKGPGDRLQDNQLRWLDYCAMHGMPVRVCHVRWAEAHPGDDMAAADQTMGIDLPGRP